MTRYRAANAMATLPFDKIDSVAGAFLHDDFLTATAVADLVDANGAEVASELTWLGSEVAGAAVSNVTILDGEADHPGIISLNVGATTPADGDAAALQLGGAVDDAQQTVVLDTNGVYVAAVIRIPDVSDQKVEFGLIGQAPAAVNSSVLDAVNFVWDPEDAANVGDELFICQVNAAGTDVESVADGVSYVEDDWVLLEIVATSTDATFRITTEDGTQTVNVQPDAMPTVGLRPAFVVENVGAAQEVLEIDSFHLRYLRRGENTSDWLGA